MTDKLCKDWMQKMGFLHRWLLPEYGLNAGTVYAGRPVGNSPELMPWDCKLNADVLSQLNRHVLFTKHLPNDDARKFSLATPKQIDSCFIRLVDQSEGVNAGVPSRKLTAEDIGTCMTSNILAIIAHDGTIIEGLEIGTAIALWQAV